MLEQWKNGNLFNKTLYSLNGLRVSFMTEKAVRNEFLTAACLVALALFFDCDLDDVFLVFLASLFPIVVELINTAVERRIDTNDGPAFREDVRAGKTENALMPVADTLSVMETLDECRRQNKFTYPAEIEGV